MSDDNERSVGSDGSVEPAAWAVYLQGCAVSVFLRKLNAEDAAKSHGVIAPLYRSPTLTEAEREAIADGIYLCEGEAGQASENVNANAWAKAAGVLRALLERLK